MIPNKYAAMVANCKIKPRIKPRIIPHKSGTNNTMSKLVIISQSGTLSLSTGKTCEGLVAGGAACCKGVSFFTGSTGDET